MKCYNNHRKSGGQGNPMSRKYSRISRRSVRDKSCRVDEQIAVIQLDHRVFYALGSSSTDWNCFLPKKKTIT